MDQHAALVHAKIDEETHPRGGHTPLSDTSTYDTALPWYPYERDDVMNSILKRAAELSPSTKNGRTR